VTSAKPARLAELSEKFSKSWTAQQKKKSKRIFFFVDPLLKKVDLRNFLLEAALVAGHLLPEGIFFPPIGSAAFQVGKMKKLQNAQL
jgi:hypothetical protein